MYILTEAHLTRLRTALTRAQKVGPVNTREARVRAATRTINACETAYRVFEAKGYPDTWSNWQRAFDDAADVITRETGKFPIGGNPF